MHEELENEVDVWTILKKKYEAMTQTWPVPAAPSKAAATQFIQIVQKVQLGILNVM